jgi:hypothetical protein
MQYERQSEGWGRFVAFAMERPLLLALADIDAMTVEKIENYERWKAARNSVLDALKAAREIARCERALTGEANKVRRG